MPTPTPPYLNAWAELSGSAHLEESAPEASALITTLPWVADGISESERNAAQALVDLGLVQPLAVYILMAKPWLADGLNETELAVVQSLESIAQHHEGLAVRIISRPFLRTVEDIDIFLLDEFEQGWGVYTLPVARDIADAIDALANESWVADGIDEHERAILERLRGAQGGFTLFYWRTGFVSVMSALISEPWVHDGLAEHEWALLEIFTVHWPTSVPYIVDALVDEPWVQDGLDEDERFLMRLGTDSLDADEAPVFVHFVDTLVDEAWVRDGLNEDERYLLRESGRYVWRDAGGFSGGGGASMVQFINALAVEPWLQDGLSTDEEWLLSIGPWWDDSYQIRDTSTRLRTIDALLVQPWFHDGLNRTERFFAYYVLQQTDTASADTLSHANRILDAAWVKDGVDENEFLFITQAINAYNFSAVISKMADLPFPVTVEERVITLPLSGEVPLVIVHSLPGPTRSMDGLEYAVRGVEALIGAPLPVPVVRLLLDSVGDGAGHTRDYIVLPAGSDGTDWLDGAIIQEVARYYGRVGEGWVAEGAARVTEDIVGEPRSGKPVNAYNYPCAHASSIAELEHNPHYGCSYALGKRIFVDMYRTLGGELFQQGLHNLHSRLFDIDSFRRAFTSAAPDQAEAVDAVVDRWYNGPQPRGVPPPDTGPVDPVPEGLQGRVTAADIVLRDGTPAAQVDAEKAAKGVFLRFELSFQHVDAPREVTMTFVGHFEDGFTYHHSVRTFSIPAGITEHTEWEWLGVPTSADDLVSGQYWVHVYHEDNKMAEAVFEVDLDQD